MSENGSAATCVHQCPCYRDVSADDSLGNSSWAFLGFANIHYLKHLFTYVIFCFETQ